MPKPKQNKRKQQVGSTLEDLAMLKPSYMSLRKRQKAIEVDCYCEMTDKQKNIVEICLEDREFSEVYDLIGVFVKRARILCLDHLKKFARAIDIEVLNQNYMTLISQFKAVYKNVCNC